MPDVKEAVLFRHQFDKTGECSLNGKRSEDRFLRCASWHGWNAIPANFDLQTKHRVDFLITRGEILHRIDVKGLKKIKRSDSDFCFDRIWVELERNNRKESSWLYGGLSDFVAFETKTSFILVKRDRLAQAVGYLVDFNGIAKSAYDALYKTYQRPSKNGTDLLSQIHIKDVYNICNDEWEKIPTDCIYPKKY